jgi:hypothetical protein
MTCSKGSGGGRKPPSSATHVVDADSVPIAYTSADDAQHDSGRCYDGEQRQGDPLDVKAGTAGGCSSSWFSHGVLHLRLADQDERPFVSGRFRSYGPLELIGEMSQRPTRDLHRCAGYHWGEGNQNQWGGTERQKA